MPPATAVVSGQRIGTSWKVWHVACAQRGEAKHEEQRGCEQRRCGHQAKESGDGDEEYDGERSNATDTIAKPTAQHTCRGSGQRRQHGEFAGQRILGYVELRVVERWQESSKTDEAAKGNDVDQVEIPAVLFKKATEMLPE